MVFEGNKSSVCVRVYECGETGHTQRDREREGWKVLVEVYSSEIFNGSFEVFQINFVKYLNISIGILF